MYCSISNRIFLAFRSCVGLNEVAILLPTSFFSLQLLPPYPGVGSNISKLCLNRHPVSAFIEETSSR